MAKHYFHCTDGHSLVVDRRGRPARSRRQIEGVAALVAADLMRSAPPSVEWDGWVVSVQNRQGYMVGVVPFPAGRA
jgi:hypothetical protein